MERNGAFLSSPSGVLGSPRAPRGLKEYQGFKRQTGVMGRRTGYLRTGSGTGGPQPYQWKAVRRSLKGLVSTWSQLQNSKAGPALAQMTLKILSPLRSLLLGSQCQGASSQFLCGSSSGGGRSTYFKLQYTYMDTVMEASWWGRNRKR